MIAAIENAMLARLKAAADAGALGYVWKLLETYPQRWDALMKDKMEFRGPGAWASFAGLSDVQRLDGGGSRAKAHFGLVVAASNLRNETATRHGGGSPAEPGSYQLLADATGLLVGQDLGLDIDRLILVEAQLVDLAGTEWGKRNVSMWALHLTTMIELAPLDFAADAPVDFETFHANWDVRPFGGIDAAPGAPGIQLPDDARADATDSVSLPQ